MTTGGGAIFTVKAGAAAGGGTLKAGGATGAAGSALGVTGGRTTSN